MSLPGLGTQRASLGSALRAADLMGSAQAPGSSLIPAWIPAETQTALVCLSRVRLRLPLEGSHLLTPEESEFSLLHCWDLDPFQSQVLTLFGWPGIPLEITAPASWEGLLILPCHILFHSFHVVLASQPFFK